MYDTTHLGYQTQDVLQLVQLSKSNVNIDDETH